MNWAGQYRGLTNKSFWSRFTSETVLTVSFPDMINFESELPRATGRPQHFTPRDGWRRLKRDGAKRDERYREISSLCRQDAEPSMSPLPHSQGSVHVDMPYRHCQRRPNNRDVSK